MARVFEGRAPVAERIFGLGERVFLRAVRVDASGEMTWTTYAVAVLVFNVAGMVVVYALQRQQGSLPFYPRP